MGTGVEVNVEVTPLFQCTRICPARATSWPRKIIRSSRMDPGRFEVCDNTCLSRDVYIYNLSTLLTFKKENRNKM